MTLDKILAKHANQIALSRALEVELRKDAVRFFRTIIICKQIFVCSQRSRQW